MRRLGVDFAGSALRPRWDDLDGADADLLDEILKQASAAGILGFAVPESAGGSGLGAMEYGYFIEEVSRACGGVGALLCGHFAGIAPLLMSGGDGAIAILSKISETEKKGMVSFFTAAVREGASPEFISEEIGTTIEKRGGGYVLKGMKTGVIGGSVAAYFNVLARDAADGTLCWVVVPRDGKGVEVRAGGEKIGLKICPVNHVAFSDVDVPEGNIVSRFTDRHRLSDFHRFVDRAYAAAAIGMAAEACEAALKYSMERYQGGKMICDHDAIRMMLAEMEVGLRAAKGMAYGPDAGYLASAFAAEAAEKICLDAVQTCGGYGYMKDYRVERILRDAKSFRAIVDSRARRMEFIRDEIEKLR